MEKMKRVLCGRLLTAAITNSRYREVDYVR